MPVSSRLRQALRWGEDEVDELAAEILDVKVFAYVETLSDLLLEHGVEHDRRTDIDLSNSILNALVKESRLHARMIVDTFNRDLDGFLERNADLPKARLLDTYRAWAEDRTQARAELIAVTETYTAAADAELAFWQANAPEELEDPEYDFGAHAPGETPAECDVCEALERTSPHPLSRVLEIGNPHPNCRQSWRAVGVELAEEVRLPTKPAGMVGADSLVIREGDHASAVAAIEGMVGDV